MDQIRQWIQKIGLMRLLILILCGVFLMALSRDREDHEPESQAVDADTAAAVPSDTYKHEREQELRSLLQKAEGVGEAEVMITIRASNEKVTLKDNTSSGERSEEKTVLVENRDRDSSPYIIQEKEPEIEGIVIVCGGGDDPAIKREITDAVSALFSIDSHKIKVMKRKEAKE